MNKCTFVDEASPELAARYLKAIEDPFFARMLTEAFAGYARRVVEGDKVGLTTRFAEPSDSSTVHGWDLILAGAEAVVRTFDLDGLSGIPRFSFRSSVSNNLKVQVGKGDLARPEDALAHGTFYSINDGIFTVWFTPSDKPLLDEGSVGLCVSPFAAAFSALKKEHGVGPVPLKGIPQALRNVGDFGDVSVMLNVAFCILTEAGAGLLPPRSEGRTLIAGIKNLTVPKFRTLMDPDTVVRSELVGVAESKRSGVPLMTVTSHFFSPRNGRDGACTTTYAMPSLEQLVRITEDREPSSGS